MSGAKPGVPLPTRVSVFCARTPNPLMVTLFDETVQPRKLLRCDSLDGMQRYLSANGYHFCGGGVWSLPRATEVK